MATYYVNINTGSNTNNGLSSGQAFQTLQKAADTAVAGDNVTIASGSYSSGMNFYGKTGGNLSNPITFSAQSGAILTHCGTTGINAALAGINVENTGGYYIFEDFRIVSDGSMQRAGIRINNSNGCIIRRCEIDSAFIGVFFSSTSGTVVEDCNLHDSTDQHGMYAGGNSIHYILRRNLLHDNNWDGLHTNATNGNPNDYGTIERNKSYGNNLSGMDVEGTTNATFKNNIIYGNAKHGIVFHYQDQPNTPVCENNTVVNNTIISNDKFCLLCAEGSDNQVAFNNILYHTNPGSYGSVGVSTTTPRIKSDYNAVSNNFSYDKGVTHVTLASWRSSTGEDANSILADISTAVEDLSGLDFHPVDGSPIVDAGGAIESKSPPDNDYDDTDRPQGSTYDIGAYEFVDGTSTPTDPSSLAATQTNPFSITLTWSQDSSNENWTEIERSTNGGSNWSALTTVDPLIRVYIDTGLTIGQAYTYRVRAVNWVGPSNYSNTVTQTGPNSPSTPATPTSLVATTNGFNEIDLVWVDNATGETAYHVERAEGSNGSFVEITSLSAGATSYTDTGLDPTQQYRYRVRAENATVYSAYSNISSDITVSIDPGQYSVFNTGTDVPATVDGGPDNSSSLNVGMRFQVVMDVEVTALRFYKGVTNTGTHILRIWTPTEDLVADLTFTGESASGWQQQNLPSPITLSPGTVYTVALYSPTGTYSLTSNYFTETIYRGPIQVDTTNGSYIYTDLGNAWFPNNVSPTNSNYWVDLVINLNLEIPVGPSDLAADVDGTSAIITWTDNSLDEEGFKIERSVNGGSFAQIDTVSYGETSYTDTGLDPELVYRYRVRAYNSAGNSGYTNTVLVGDAIVPEVPSNLAADPSAGMVILSWNANIDDTVSYLIYRSTDDSAYSLIQTVSGISTITYSDTSVVPGTTYYYKITAKDNASPAPNESDRSESISVTPTNYALGASTLSYVYSTPTSVSVSFTAASGGVPSIVYNIHKSTTSGFTVGSSNLHHSTVTSPYIVASGLTQGQLWYFKLVAIDNDANTAVSNQITGGLAFDGTSSPSDDEIAAAVWSYSRRTLTD